MSYRGGRVVGGSSEINYMAYTRGHRRDFDRWEEEGNNGWSYNEVEPFFLKSEMANNLSNAQPGFHNYNGLLSVSDSYQTPMGQDFLQAGVEMGYNIVDYTGYEAFGFSRVKTNTYKGERADVASAYLKLFHNKPHRVIQANSYVTKIIIDSENRACGVEYVKDGVTYTVNARKEVILSAGPFNSPKLLMLSGIGPKKCLTEFCIEVKKDLPVGQNMKDHIAYYGLAFLANSSVLRGSDFTDPDNINEYNTNRTGIYSSIGGIEALAYIKTNASEEIGDYPDIELIKTHMALTTDADFAWARSKSISKEFYDAYLKSIENEDVFSIIPMLLHPKSVGELTLASTDPFDPPLFYPGYFTDPEGEDMKTMIEAIRFTLELVKTDPMQKYNVTYYDKPIPGCEDKTVFEEYWECAIRTVSVSMEHQTGTCRMGSNSRISVVDDRLRVHGVTKLRVVDTSVIPVTISGHLSADGVMLGEKAAVIIKEDYRKI